MDDPPGEPAMLLSTSARERRLWIWTAIVVATIFASLGLARSLAGALRDRELIDALFITGLFMIGVAVVAVGLRLRPRGLEIGVALGVAAVYLIVFARMTIPEERSHLIEYGVVALLVHEALVERRANGGGVARPALAAFAVTVVIGVVDECVQLLLPRRVFDPLDMLFDAIAAALAIGAIVALRWARRRVAGA